MKKYFDILKNNFSFIEILLILSPIIDFASFITNKFNIVGVSFSAFIRFAILFFAYIYIFKNNKKVCLIISGIITFFILGFIGANYPFINLKALLKELVFILKLLYYPIMLLFFIVYCNKKEFKNLGKTIKLTSFIYIGIIYIAMLMSTSRETYYLGDFPKYFFFSFRGFINALLVIIPFILLKYFSNKKVTTFNKILNAISNIYIVVIAISLLCISSPAINAWGKQGEIGWFSSPNEISNLLAIMSPIAIYEISKIKFNINRYSLFIIYAAGLLIIGTKTAYFALFGSLIIYLVLNIINYFMTKKGNILFFVIAIAISGVLFYFSPNCYNYLFQRNRFNQYKEEQEKGKIDPSQEPLGIDDESQIIDAIYSGRKAHREFKIQSVGETTILQKIFGSTIYNGTNVEIIAESDYFDIYYSYGILGVILYLIMPIYIFIFGVFKILRKLSIYIKKIDYLCYMVTLALVLFIAYFAGHVYFAPAVSIYGAIVGGYIYNCFHKERKEV